MEQDLTLWLWEDTGGELWMNMLGVDGDKAEVFASSCMRPSGSHRKTLGHLTLQSSVKIKGFVFKIKEKVKTIEHRGPISISGLSLPPCAPWAGPACLAMGQ